LASEAHAALARPTRKTRNSSGAASQLPFHLLVSARWTLTNSPGSDFTPAWSADGRRIAFTSHRQGNWDVYAINSDGTSLQRLTSDPGFDGFPDWARGQ